MTIDFSKYAQQGADLAWTYKLDLFPLLLGPLSALAIMFYIESKIPLTVNAKHATLIKLVTGIGVLPLAWLFCVLLWGIFDSGDSFYVRAIVSISWSPIAMFVYPKAGAWATKKFPSIASVWATP